MLAMTLTYCALTAVAMIPLLELLRILCAYVAGYEGSHLARILKGDFMCLRRGPPALHYFLRGIRQQIPKALRHDDNFTFDQILHLAEFNTLVTARFGEGEITHESNVRALLARSVHLCKDMEQFEKCLHYFNDKGMPSHCLQTVASTIAFTPDNETGLCHRNGLFRENAQAWKNLIDRCVVTGNFPLTDKLYHGQPPQALIERFEEHFGKADVRTEVMGMLYFCVKYERWDDIRNMVLTFEKYDKHRHQGEIKACLLELRKAGQLDWVTSAPVSAPSETSVE